MKNLAAKQLKKGMEVYMVTPWNFFYGCTGNHTNNPGRLDSYKIEKVVIHSCGKKRMYLTDCDNFSKREYNVRENGYFGKIWFCSSMDEALELTKEMHEDNPTKTENYTIVN